MDLSKTTGTIGRDEILGKLYKDTTRGKHRILVSDEKGVGRKTILRALYDTCRADGKNAIFVENPAPIKQFLIEMVRQLHENRDLKLYEYESRFDDSKPWHELSGPIGKLNIRDLSTIVIKSLQDASEKYVLIINDLERITESQEPYLNTLAEHTTIVGATNNKGKAGRFNKIWDELKEVKVPLLKDSDIKMIADRFIQSKAIVVDDKQLLLTTIAKESRGNPSACASILSELMREKVIKKEYIRKIRTGASIREVDMTPLIFVVAACFMGMRFLSLGLDNPMLYILAGMSYAAFAALRPLIYKVSRGR